MTSHENQMSPYFEIRNHCACRLCGGSPKPCPQCGQVPTPASRAPFCREYVCKCGCWLSTRGRHPTLIRPAPGFAAWVASKAGVREVQDLGWLVIPASVHRCYKRIRRQGIIIAPLEHAPQDEDVIFG